MAACSAQIYRFSVEMKIEDPAGKRGAWGRKAAGLGTSRADSDGCEEQRS